MALPYAVCCNPFGAVRPDEDIWVESRSTLWVLSVCPPATSRLIGCKPMTSTSPEGLNNHLLAFGDDTEAFALAIAARSALRAIPLLEHLSWDKPLRRRMRAGLGRQRMSNSAIVLGTFRSTATAWVAARFPAFGMSNRFHEIKHSARMAGGAEDAGNTAASHACHAPHMAMMAAISVFSNHPPQNSSDKDKLRQDAALDTVQTVTTTAIGFREAYGMPAAELVHGAAWEDVRRLETDGDSAQSLLMQPLWLVQNSKFASDDWRSLTARLLGRTDENWNIWIGWYEARLAGGGELAESQEVARVSLPDEVWAQGPAVANAEISRFIA